MNLASTPTPTAPALRQPRREPLAIREAVGARRAEYERFIAARFAEVYGARLQHFMPRLFGLHEADGRLIAAFGLRGAADEPLFLQRYLDAPAEQLVADRVGTTVARERIVEVGNLAGATPGALRQLIPALTRHLHARGDHWVLFTGSARLCNGFTRLGLPLSLLAAADPLRLPEAERALWGSYYAQQPAVMLGDVRAGDRHLQALAQSPQGLDLALAAVARMGTP